MKVLLIDNFDSFTYNLVDYIKQCGVECDVIRNDIDPDQININDYQRLVLSPGPETPDKAGNLMKIINNFSTKLPILGICLGHQALGIYFGASLVKAHKPMHGKISEIICENDQIFQNIPVQNKVVRYHSLILENLPESLNTIAKTKSGEIMGFSHKNLAIKGLQFHPEAFLTTYGKQMIKNWIDFC